ncbi:hypothetical protein J4E00_03500 [Siccationidurans soli]|uniref:Four helix bundle protein n=1 Tax=Hymenobacter negativus TaxID=2795026 RepID=A0ABS3QA29_9BACT|nr:hypothetical protein [Hymenobacter negativus]
MEWLRTGRKLSGYFARLSFSFLSVSTPSKRSYSTEDFSELISAQLQRLESHTEARQRYGSLLAVLRQQVDSYRQRKAKTK